MAITFPDDGEGDNTHQSILFQEYWDAYVAANAGIDGVLSGCGATGGADMTPAIAKGAIIGNYLVKPVTAGDVTIGTAHSTLPRIDLIVADSTGAKQVRAGTAADPPKPPARSANDTLLWEVRVPAGATAIGTAQLIDKRCPIRLPCVIHKVTSPVTFNTTSTIQTYLTVVIPDGLLIAGRILRLRAGGNYLSNSGSPTWTFTVSYGGTNVFADATAGTTADGDRGAWNIEYELCAQGNSDQASWGNVRFQTPAGKAVPTTGIAGDLALTTSVNSPVAGAAGTINSDSADRTLTLSITMSVNNAAVETVMEFGYVELVA